MTKKMALLAFAMGVALVLLAGSILMKNDFLHVYPQPPGKARESEKTKEDLPATGEPGEPGKTMVDLLLVVNKSHPLADDFEPVGLREASVAAMDGKAVLVDEAAAALEEMFAAAKADGVELACYGAYRSKERQETLYQSYVDARDAAYADEVCVRPRHCENETGLAVDLSREIGEGFAATAEGQWLAANASAYGFVLRYPLGKEEVTGFAFAPGHYRYVGKEAAEAMTEAGLTLEEYLGVGGGSYGD